MIERAFWLHGWTDKALLLGTSPISTGPKYWFAISQIEELERGLVNNPNLGAHPGVSLYLGTRVKIRAPKWLIERSRLPQETEYADC